MSTVPRRPARPDALPRCQERGGARGDARDHARAAALHAARLRRRRLRPDGRQNTRLLLRIVASGVATALAYAAVSPVSSFTTRRAAAAVAVVLVLLVPVSVVRSAIEAADAPNALDLLNLPFVAAEALVPHLRREAKLGRADRGAFDVARRRGPRRLGRGGRRGVLAPLPPDRGVPVSASASAGSWPACPVVPGARRRVRRELRHRPRGDRAAGPERGGEVDDAADAVRAGAAVEGIGSRARPRPRADAGVTRAIGLVPQQETVFESLTALGFLRLTGTLHGLPDPEAAGAGALELVGLGPPIRGGSRPTRKGCASG